MHIIAGGFKELMYDITARKKVVSDHTLTNIQWSSKDQMEAPTFISIQILERGQYYVSTTKNLIFFSYQWDRLELTHMINRQASQ